MIIHIEYLGPETTTSIVVSVRGLSPGSQLGLNICLSTVGLLSSDLAVLT